MGDCRNCGEPASATHTVVFGSGTRIDDIELCEQCRTFFSEAAPMELREAPVLVRGGAEEP